MFVGADVKTCPYYFLELNLIEIEPKITQDYCSGILEEWWLVISHCEPSQR